MSVLGALPNVELKVRPAPRTGPAVSIKFHNRREIWQAKRAAKKLNLSFNTYVRLLMQEHSKMVLNGKAAK